jgi:hypothetical protein
MPYKFANIYNSWFVSTVGDKKFTNLGIVLADFMDRNLSTFNKKQMLDYF